MGNQSSRQSVENVLENHYKSDIKQTIENNCAFTNTDTNSLVISGNRGGSTSNVNQTIDAVALCNNYLKAFSEVDMTTELKNDMKAKMEQKGFQFFTNQSNKQETKNKVLNMIEQNSFQKTLNNCIQDTNITNDLVISNNVDHDIENINQTQTRALDCIFENNSTNESKARVRNNIKNKSEADLKQEGFTLFASAGSSISLIVVGTLMFILFIMTTGKKNGGARAPLMNMYKSRGFY